MANLKQQMSTTICCFFLTLYYKLGFYSVLITEHIKLGIQVKEKLDSFTILFDTILICFATFDTYITSLVTIQGNTICL